MAARLVSLSSVALTRYSSFSGLLPLARMEPSGSTDKVVPRVDLASTGLSRVQLRDGRSASACASAWFDNRASSVVAAVITRA